MNSEFGLFVIWSAAEHLRSRVLQAVADRFEIRGVHRITWSADHMSENFGRFYQSARLTPPFHTYFEHQKGCGPFTVVTVLDHHPAFAHRETNRGVRAVNTRLFDAKQDFRRWSELPQVIHATETTEEATRDLYMLLGIPPGEYLRKHPSSWQGVVEHHAREVTGASGWASLRDAFDALNNLLRYVVLRNFERLPNSHLVGDHDDVDLLVDDYREAVRILNARPVTGLVPPWGGRFHVSVSGRPVTFDIRFPGDGYFDQEWQREVLERRRLSDAGIFIPCGRDYFETLAYHALAHKRRLSEEYSRRLTEMAAAEGLMSWTPERLTTQREARRLLDTLLRDKGRDYVRPRDVTVFYNFGVAGCEWAWTRRKLAGLRRNGAVRWWRVKATVVRAAMETRYGLVRCFPTLRRLRRPIRYPSNRGPIAARPETVPAIVVDIQSITGLQTSRILSDRAIPVIGIGTDPSEPFCRSRVFCRKVFTSTTDEGLIKTLVELGPTLPAKAPLFLSADESVLLVSRHRDRLARWYQFALPDHATVETLVDKIGFLRFAEQNGLPIPKTAVVDDLSEARRVADEFRFPVLLKPAIRAEHWARHTKAKAFKVLSREELLDTYARVRAWGDRVIAQEWIPGPESNLFSCNAYFGATGEALVTFVARKIRQWPPETGRSSLGVECRNDEVRETAIRLFQAAKFRGPAYLEMKRDERDGRLWIVEPNVGRATGRSAIAEAGGVELLLTQYCDLLGLPLPERREQQYTGAKWIYLRWDLQASLVGMLGGRLTPAEWWESLRGPKFDAAWSRRDPLPFLMDFSVAAARGIKRTFQLSGRKRKRDGRARARYHSDEMAQSEV